jgi:hypothetical protein
VNAHDRVYQVDFTKEKLAAMQAEERRLLLLLGHAANEINVLFLGSLVVGRRSWPMLPPRAGASRPMVFLHFAAPGACPSKPVALYRFLFMRLMTVV